MVLNNGYVLFKRNYSNRLFFLLKWAIIVFYWFFGSVIFPYAGWIHSYLKRAKHKLGGIVKSFKQNF